MVKKIKPQNIAAAQKDCYYPECLQCCCTSGKNGDMECQYEELAGTIRITKGPMNEVFRGALYGCLFMAAIIVLVSSLLYFWPNG